MKKLIIIYYHDIVENGKGYSYQKVEKEHFENQMKYLKEHGYQTILFVDMEKFLPEKASWVLDTTYPAFQDSTKLHGVLSLIIGMQPTDNASNTTCP